MMARPERKYVLGAAICVLLFSFGVGFAKTFEVKAPSDLEILEAVKKASEETGVRPAVLYGLLSQETALGTNLGKTEAQWKAFCAGPLSNSEPCRYWKKYDCKKEYKNARRYDDVLKELGFVDRLSRADRSQIPTSFTCALGFTQFESDTWWDVSRAVSSEKVLSPWDINDSVRMAAYYLRDLGASSVEKIGAYEVMGEGDRIALRRYYCGGNWALSSCADYAYGVEAFAQSAPPELLSEELRLRLEVLQKERLERQRRIEEEYKARQRQFEPPPFLPPSFFHIKTSNLPSGFFGVPYSVQLEVEGGTAPYQWAVKDYGEGLPKGLKLDPVYGFISGTPVSEQEGGDYFNFEVQATDRNGALHTVWLSIFLEQKAVLIASENLPNATKGRAYSVILSAQEGIPPYIWSIEGAYTQGGSVIEALPKGLKLDSQTGIISGTPEGFEDQSGYFSFNLRVRDSAGATTVKWMNIALDSIPVRITSETLPKGVVRAPYSFTPSADGGIAPYTWSIQEVWQISESGEKRIVEPLPEGLSLDSHTGIISGIPLKGQYTGFNLEVKDSVGTKDQKWINIVVEENNVRLTTFQVPEGTVRVPYSFTLSADGGFAPYTWRLVPGVLPEWARSQISFGVSQDILPTGLAIDPLTGIISGTPENGGSWYFTVEVRDQVGSFERRFMNIFIKEVPVFITSTNLSNARVGKFYSETLFANGGFAPYTWSIEPGGVLPAGLALDREAGIISGNATSSGAWNFNVKVTDTVGSTHTRQFSIRVESSQPIPPSPPFPPTGGTATSPSSFLVSPSFSAQILNVGRLFLELFFMH